MTAERRHCPRHPLSLHVQVLYGKRRFCSARVRSLTPQGMSLTLRNLTIPPGTLVELELDGPGGDRLVDAVVVHSSGSDVGVVFREPQPDLYESLIQAGSAGVPDAEIAVSPLLSRAERPQLARH